jgi:hypothetical protein
MIFCAQGGDGNVSFVDFKDYYLNKKQGQNKQDVKFV